MKDRNNQMFMPYDQNAFYPYPYAYPYMQNNLENRVESLERMVKKLENRISKLENSTTNVYGNEYNTSIPDIYNQNIYPNAMHMM